MTCHQKHTLFLEYPVPIRLPIPRNYYNSVYQARNHIRSTTHCSIARSLWNAVNCRSNILKISNLKRKSRNSLLAKEKGSKKSKEKPFKQIQTSLVISLMNMIKFYWRIDKTDTSSVFLSKPEVGTENNLLFREPNCLYLPGLSKVQSVSPFISILVEIFLIFDVI